MDRETHSCLFMKKRLEAGRRHINERRESSLLDKRRRTVVRVNVSRDNRDP